MTRIEQEVLALLGYFFLTQGMADRAAALYAALDVIEPGEPSHLRPLALAQSRAGRPQQALVALDRLALAGAFDAPFHALRAQVLEELGRSDEAAASMRAYMDLRAGPVDAANQANPANPANPSSPSSPPSPASLASTLAGHPQARP